MKLTASLVEARLDLTGVQFGGLQYLAGLDLGVPQGLGGVRLGPVEDRLRLGILNGPLGRQLCRDERTGDRLPVTMVDGVLLEPLDFLEGVRAPR